MDRTRDTSARRSLTSRPGPLAPATLLLLASLASLPGIAVAAANEPAGGCHPACRTGFFCREGQCVSLCNPPCPRNQRCTSVGECVALSHRSKLRARSSYLGVFGGYRAAINNSGVSAGEVRLEFGGQYGAMQIGPAFGDHVTQVRSALFGKVPFRLTASLPLYLVPTVALGYTFSWVDDPNKTRWQDIFISPGIRVRYDPIPRLALFANLIEVEINFLRLAGDRYRDFERIDTVPLVWSLSLGVAFLY